MIRSKLLRRSAARVEKQFPRLERRPLPEKPRITVMITTQNRSSDLEKTLTVLTEMECGPDDIILTADGCTDSTVQIVQQKFPTCQLLINEAPIGSVASRDRMIRNANADIVVSLDDDSYPIDAAFFAELPSVFQRHPNAAVVTFPELRDGDIYANELKTPLSKGHCVSAYPNCAAAMLRSAYLDQPGFPAFFGHMYEETDYALQCYADGYSVWFEPSLTIRHHVSPNNRGWMRRHHLNARNELWSVWMRCPWPWLPIVSIYRILRQFVYACSEGLLWVLNEPRWWISALGGLLSCLRQRCPVPWSVYYSWMRLARHPRFDECDFVRRRGDVLSNALPASVAGRSNSND